MSLGDMGPAFIGARDRFRGLDKLVLLNTNEKVVARSAILHPLLAQRMGQRVLWPNEFVDTAAGGSFLRGLPFGLEALETRETNDHR